MGDCEHGPEKRAGEMYIYTKNGEFQGDFRVKNPKNWMRGLA